MQEELTVHQEEGRIVDTPEKEEESSVVPKTVAHSYKRRQSK